MFIDDKKDDKELFGKMTLQVTQVLEFFIKQ